MPPAGEFMPLGAYARGGQIRERSDLDLGRRVRVVHELHGLQAARVYARSAVERARDRKPGSEDGVNEARHPDRFRNSPRGEGMCVVRRYDNQMASERGEKRGWVCEESQETDRELDQAPPRAGGQEQEERREGRGERDEGAKGPRLTASHRLTAGG
jgi:hypothetical protein